jgi:hypothetical protein
MMAMGAQRQRRSVSSVDELRRLTGGARHFEETDPTASDRQADAISPVQSDWSRIDCIAIRSKEGR